MNQDVDGATSSGVWRHTIVQLSKIVGGRNFFTNDIKEEVEYFNRFYHFSYLFLTLSS